MPRRTAAAGARLRNARDALDVIGYVLDATTTAVALVDQPPPSDGVVACCDGPMTRADLDRFDAYILEAVVGPPRLETGDQPPPGSHVMSAGPPSGCRMVLGTWRLPGLDMVDEADIELWRALQARHNATDVPLLDWFVVSGAHAFSLAELVGPRARWRRPR